MMDSDPALQLQSRLRTVEASKANSYDKRTEHIDADGNTLFINRLILEDSPYLLQHAHNPVNWYAWGSEAFATAAAENKPVFLSIGYSTCHWCHVMEVESFDNVAVAKLLNQHFISIKLDREQYPDLDEIYMTGVQLMSGHGGWPMSNFLLPDGRPFFGATYFPPQSFLQILDKISAAWRDQYEELETSAASIDQAIKRILGNNDDATAIDSGLLADTVQALYQREDRALGGLAGAPKFPQEPLLLLLLDQAARERDLDAIDFVSRALAGMARGGIYDQVGGGFHRYSVDSQWLVPHFEKMLYNQSQLGLVYLQAWQLTGNDFFKRICQQTLDYVLRDMQQTEGGFFSATDADSEDKEGTFFLWSEQQLQELLPKQQAEQAAMVYGVTTAGNFEGSNILHLPRALYQLEQEFGEGFVEELDRIRDKLYQHRELRIHPLRDDKLIVAWVGAMIATLATAAAATSNQRWLQAAEKAARLILQHNVNADGRLLRIYLNGTCSIDGQLEDYANFCQGLLRLFDVTQKLDYLQHAASLMDAALMEFWDSVEGGFFLSPGQHAGPQLTRSKNASDGATLSAVATALECLQDLWGRAALLDNLAEESAHKQAAAIHYKEKINACRSAVAGQLNENPISHPGLLRCLEGSGLGSLRPMHYAGNGLVRIHCRSAATLSADVWELEFVLSLSENWHITAAQAAGTEFVPFSVTLLDDECFWTLMQVDYAKANGSIDDGRGSQQLIYENEVVVKVQLQGSAAPHDSLSAAAGIGMCVQLCNQQHCLLAEQLQMRVPLIHS
jgi:uncharacterized protein